MFPVPYSFTFTNPLCLSDFNAFLLVKKQMDNSNYLMYVKLYNFSYFKFILIYVNKFGCFETRYKDLIESTPSRNPYYSIQKSLEEMTSNELLTGTRNDL